LVIAACRQVKVLYFRVNHVSFREKRKLERLVSGTPNCTDKFFLRNWGDKKADISISSFQFSRFQIFNIFKTGILINGTFFYSGIIKMPEKPGVTAICSGIFR
jgi:hypothetical protein